MAKFTSLLTSLFMITGSLFAQDPSASLKHSWTFETGNTDDMQGTANGVLEGSAQISTTSLGDQGAVLSGGFVILDAVSIGINNYSEVSLEVWFTPTANANTGGFSMVAYLGGSEPPSGDPGGATLGSNGFFLQPTRNDGVARAAISCGNTDTPWSSETGVNTTGVLDGDQLYHGIITIDATAISFYVDGVLIGSETLSSQNNLASVSPTNAWLGRGGYGNDPTWLGTIHEVNIYDKVLTQAEVDFLGAKGVEMNTDAIDGAGVASPSVFEAQGAFFVQNLNPGRTYSLEVYNLAGQQVMSESHVTEKVSHSLQPDLYVAILRDDNNAFATKLMVR